MVNKFEKRLPENSENGGKKITKVALAALLASALQQPAKANNTNNDLAAALRGEGYKTVKVYRYGKDGKAGELIVKEKNDNQNFKLDLKHASSNTYPAFLNIYGVGQKVGGNSYNGVGMKIHNKYFEGVAEKGPDYTKAGAIGKINFGNTGAYTKLGISYLNFKNYKVGEYTINPTQKTYGGALGYGNNSFNIEGGYIAHKLSGAKGADTTAYTKYLELVDRIQSQIGQFDVSGTIKNQKAYDNSKTYFDASGAYYPTKDIQLKTTYDNSRPYTKNDVEIEAGFKYVFGGNKKGSFSPYLGTEYAAADNIKFAANYAKLIANRPPSWKDEFENNMNTNQIVAQKIAPEEFNKKVIDSFNQPPKISISASATNITEGQSVTLTANASDPDGTVKEIDWYDQNGNKIGSGKSITITPSSTGTFTYYAEAIDNNGAVSKSKEVSISVEAVPTPTFTFNAGENVTKIEDTSSTLEIYRNGSSHFVVGVSATNGGYVEYDGKKYYNGDVIYFNASNWPDGKEIYEYKSDGELVKAKVIHLH